MDNVGSGGAAGSPTDYIGFSGLEPARSSESKNEAARNFSATEFIQGIVRVSKRAGRYLTTHFAGCSHRQNLP
jgi:hypothetical protein